MEGKANISNVNDVKINFFNLALRGKLVRTDHPFCSNSVITFGAVQWMTSKIKNLFKELLNLNGHTNTQ